jgi:hypothetical protein
MDLHFRCNSLMAHRLHRTLSPCGVWVSSIASIASSIAFVRLPSIASIALPGPTARAGLVPAPAKLNQPRDRVQVAPGKARPMVRAWAALVGHLAERIVAQVVYHAAAGVDHVAQRAQVVGQVEQHRARTSLGRFPICHTPSSFGIALTIPTPGGCTSTHRLRRPSWPTV